MANPKGPNRFEFLPGGCVALHVGRGLVALIDLEILPLVSRFRWHATGHPVRPYVVSTRPRTERQRTIWLHRMILGAGPGQEGDHRNGDTLDNRRSNLRLVDHARNMQNTRRKPGRSGHRGVWWNKREQKWKVGISANGRFYSLGCFRELGAAIQARANAEDRLHGEYAAKCGVLKAIPGGRAS